MTARAKQFGERLRRARKARDVTQVELAERMGIHQPTISALESGERNPSLVTIQRLADALGISPTDLIDGGGA